MRVWNNGQYSQDLSVGLLVDGSFKHGQGAYKVDSVDDVIDYALTGKIAQVILSRMKTQTTTAALMLI